jgi:DNA polymerase III delta subunit
VKERSLIEEMLRMARSTGKRASRGEGDAALLTDAVVHGGAPGAVLLMRTGDVPEESTTVKAIEKSGAVVSCDLSREAFAHALDQAVSEIVAEYDVKIDGGALTSLRKRLGIERVLADKFSKEVPDLRTIVSEIERLATLAGKGGRVTAAMVEQQIDEVSGGARYEFASLFTEGKYVDAVIKLRELIAQMRREDPRTPLDMHYGKFIFNLADELRQIIAVRSFARMKKLDPKRSMNYNQFKDSLADALGEYLKENGVVRQKPHPFVLLKKYEAARRFSDEQLFAALSELAELDFTRKSGGVPAEIGIETLVLSNVR